jgi:phosphatidate phosphatase APP1
VAALGWRQRVQRRVGRWIDVWTRRRVERRIRRDTLEPLAIVPYRGWGTPERIHVGARVLEGGGVAHGTVTDPWWRNTVAIVRRFLSDEIPGAKLRLVVAGSTHHVTTDVEGFARVEMANPGADAGAGSGAGLNGWIDVDWALVSPRPRGQSLVVTGQALVPDPRARFGVISDLDDTVLRTGITDTAGMLQTVLFNNARTRLPFPGVAAFYRALRGAGPDPGNPDPQNPVFYVSASPWNLYDVIEEFLRVQGLPPGPMFLTDWGLDARTLGQPDTRAHKTTAIQRLLDAYGPLPFVLIGDSGQHDPEIYHDVAAANPGRVLAVTSAM